VSAEVDRVAGDAAVLLVLWESIRAMIGRGGAAFLLAAVFVGLWAGRETGLRFALGGVFAAAFVGGVLGWLDLPIDLVTLPAIVSAVVAGAAYAAIGSTTPVAAALSSMAVASFSVALAGGGALATVGGILLLGPLVANSCMQSSDSHATA
jgi:hypothetical protein